MRRDLRGLIEKNEVAELNLLDYEACEVLLADVALDEFVAASEFALEAKRIDHCGDAIKPCYAVAGEFLAHRRDAADGLGNRFGFADAARFDDDVVEALKAEQVPDLGDQVHLERAADAAVLKGYEAVVLLADNSAFLDERSIDVYLADVVYDDREAYAAAVG